MSSKISVIISLDHFIEYIKPLSEKHNIYCYIERKNDSNTLSLSLLENESNIKNDLQYFGFFFSSERLPVATIPNFYDKSIFEYAIEGKGGRENEQELEKINLRLLAKKPDKKIKSFFNAIKNKLKKDEDFGIGVYAGKKNTFYKDIFYAKEGITNKTIWFDFSKKLNKITIEAK